MLVYINKKKFIPKPKPKMKLKEVFYSKPTRKADKSKAESKTIKTHKMPNGDIHTGAKHSKNSKLVRKAKLK
tara:strand:+ start:265 stop:480 length:216 start_codon:yes stop_codon:yes gene_type:complete